MKLRTGCMLYKGKEVPNGTKIITNSQGKECYVTALEITNGNWIYTVKYIEDNTFQKIPYAKLQPYLK